MKRLNKNRVPGFCSFMCSLFPKATFYGFLLYDSHKIHLMLNDEKKQVHFASEICMSVFYVNCGPLHMLRFSFFAIA